MIRQPHAHVAVKKLLREKRHGVAGLLVVGAGRVVAGVGVAHKNGIAADEILVRAKGRDNASFRADKIEAVAHSSKSAARIQRAKRTGQQCVDIKTINRNKLRKGARQIAVPANGHGVATVKATGKKLVGFIVGEKIYARGVVGKNFSGANQNAVIAKTLLRVETRQKYVH